MSGETRPAVTGDGVPLWGVQAGPALRTPPVAPLPPAVVDGDDDVDSDLGASAPIVKPVLGARLAVDVLPGGDVPGAGGQAAAKSASPPAPDLRALAATAVGPVRDLPLTHPAQAPRPLPVQDVLPGRDLLTAAPVEPRSFAARASTLPAATWTAPPSMSTHAGEADDRAVAQAAATVETPAQVPATAAFPEAAILPVEDAAPSHAAHLTGPLVPPGAKFVAEPANVPPPVAPDGTWSGQTAPTDDLSTSLALLLATGSGPEAPPSVVVPAVPAVVDVPDPVAGPVVRDTASAGVPATGGESFAAPAAGAAQDTADLVPAQVRRHVELGFRDGSTTALDPDSEQALALAELSSLLTGRD